MLIIEYFSFLLSFLYYQYVWIDNVHTTFLKSGVSSSQHDKWKIKRTKIDEKLLVKYSTSLNVEQYLLTLVK